jgi:hypothetical protein
MMAVDTSSALGFGLSWTFCTCVLPFYDPVSGSVMRAVTDIQPPLGIGTNPRTAALLPSTTAGRALLIEAIIRRISCTRGALPDVMIPTTLGNYGVDLQDSAYDDLTTVAAGELSARIDAQVQLDERVQSSVTSSALAGNILLVPISLVDGTGPFRLTLSIDTLTGDLSVLSSPQ